MEESNLCSTIMQGLPKQFDAIVTFLNVQPDELTLDVLLPQLMQVISCSSRLCLRFASSSC